MKVILKNCNDIDDTLCNNGIRRKKGFKKGY